MISDRYRWRKRFAFFPKWIGSKRIWLESYAWREVRPEEWAAVERRYPTGLPVNEVREYVVKSTGYVTWRVGSMSVGVLSPIACHAWLGPEYVMRARNAG